MVRPSNILDIPIYLIYHLEDRKNASIENFAGTGACPIYVKGFDMKKLFGKWPMPHRSGTVGCYLSFLNAFNTALREGHEYVIIGEDDMYFAENFKENFQQMFETLPEDWEAVFLGHYEFQEVGSRVNESIISHDKFHGHHAVLYKREALKKVLAETEDLISEAFDLKIIEMQNDQRLKIYLASPQICKAKSNHKDQVFKSTTDGSADTDEEYTFRREIYKKLRHG